MLKTDTAE